MATPTVLQTEEIKFSFERFILIRGMSYKLDYSIETALEWFNSFIEALDRYDEYGLSGLMDCYDPEGYCLYGRVFEQDNTDDITRTYDGCREYLNRQIKTYVDLTYSTLRQLNKLSGARREITGGFIYKPHDGSTPAKREAFVRKFTEDLAKWYGEDVEASSFEKVISLR